MVILGIDPGYDRVGVAVIEKTTSKETYIYSTCITTNKKDSIDTRVFFVAEKLEEIIREYQPEKCGIENLFMTNNQKTVMAVSESRGAMKYVLYKNKIPVYEYTPMQIKVATTGDGRATKKDIAHMIPHLIDVDIQNMIDDEVDAIAIALTCSASEKSYIPST